MKKIPSLLRTDSVIALEGRIYPNLQSLMDVLKASLGLAKQAAPDEKVWEQDVQKLLTMSRDDFMNRPSLIQGLFKEGQDTLNLDMKRLFLRSLTWDDLKSIHAYASDDEVVRYQDWGPNTLEDTSAFLRQSIIEKGQARRHIHNLGVCLRHGGDLIGGYMLSESIPYGQVEIGFSFAKAHWKQGYASECTQAIVDLLLSQPEIKVLTATADTRNTASIHVLKKAGFKKSYVWPRHKKLRTGLRDSTFLEVFEK